MINYTNIVNMSSLRLVGDYSCGAYGANAYNSTCTGTQTGSGGLLANTGYNVLLPTALGLALIIAAAILVIKRLRRRITANNK